MHTIIVDNKEVQPSKIVCVGRNYRAHIDELNNDLPESMVLFSKSNSAISNELFASPQGDEVDYEGELCFVIENNCFSAIGFGFDLTKRQLQSELKDKGLPWERAKSFDRSAVFSPFVGITTMPEQLSFDLTKNDKLVQSGSNDLMIYKPEQILSEILSFMTLYDGDIVMTGTPKGVGNICQNDRFKAQLKADNTIILEQEWLAK